jgi:hypothetical protein
VEWLIGLENAPVRRNLLITQAYHDLSTALAQALGVENANWCTFATWASRSAGRFIREDEIPTVFRALLGDSEPIGVTLARVNDALNRVHDGAALDGDILLAAARGIVHHVATLITAGNLAVFGELAPIFARALDALAADPGVTALDALCDTLTSGLSEKGGQSMLRSALEAYVAARSESDPRHKAARMLLANGQIGLHEQIRLQPFIAGAIDAPIRDSIYDALQEWGQGMPAVVRDKIHVVAGRLFSPIADGACRLWRLFATRELMTLSLPDGTLVLGKDLPAPPGTPLYPPVLDPVADPEAMTFLSQYGADRPGTPGTAAVDWSNLSDRMRFILDLFRSRQCDGALFGEPFTADQRAAMLAGKAVRGPL